MNKIKPERRTVISMVCSKERLGNNSFHIGNQILAYTVHPKLGETFNNHTRMNRKNKLSTV